ncbi:tryptophan--tRNA ligase [Natrialbaceae archaeon AArc-T1-2]|uniref:tryptophan--tRNA ligase n=1 Tax=Natrialbaceae archaeon AArc-T1-2 TaxID=3053904 RepID=UPI00255B0F49|nr:tryptophan--tRNA ligase [Natrialbaceae archaeon AArc-T1-2]WIV68635.1 tryptophan--tRNA ligase [Natrialbaceae archaeon AArc-T1-2]
MTGDETREESGGGDPRANGETAGADDVALDPWGSSSVSDYRKLFEEFGIEEFDALLEEVPTPHYLMRRGVIFGHRDYRPVAEAMANDDPFAALSGFMPTGDPHIGHKLVFDEIIWHQQQGGDAYALIADLEAHAARGMTWAEIDEHARDYLLSLLALGFDPEEGTLYRQSANRELQDLAFELGAEANFSEFQAIYGFDGETDVSHMQSVVTQMADILYPQVVDEPKPTVIPVGADQDPHVRLARDLAERMRYFGVTEAFASFETESDAESQLLEWAYSNLEESAHSQGLESEAIRCDLAAELLSKYRSRQAELQEKVPHGAEAHGSPEGSDGLFIKDAFRDDDNNLRLPDPSAESVFDDLFAVETFPPEGISTKTFDSLVTKLRNSGKEPLQIRRRFLNRNATEEAFSALIEAIPGKKRVYENHIDAFGMHYQEAKELAREIELDHGGYGFLPPSSIYHRFMTGLTGGKMSSSEPASHISLLDDPDEGYDKVKAATTGGRETAAKQRELGGKADECPVYELYAYLLSGDDDEFAKRVYDECVGGERLCGDCKEQAAQLMREFLAEHQEKREEVEDLLENTDIELESSRRR